LLSEVHDFGCLLGHGDSLNHLVNVNRLVSRTPFSVPLGCLTTGRFERNNLTHIKKCLIRKGLVDFFSPSDLSRVGRCAINSIPLMIQFWFAHTASLIAAWISSAVPSMIMSSSIPSALAICLPVEYEGRAFAFNVSDRCPMLMGLLLTKINFRRSSNFMASTLSKSKGVVNT